MTTKHEAELTQRLRDCVDLLEQIIGFLEEDYADSTWDGERALLEEIKRDYERIEKEAKGE